LAGARSTWLKKPEPIDVFDAKGMTVELVERFLRRSAIVVQVPNQPHTQHLHPRGAAELHVDGHRVGWFGPLHPDVVEAFDLGDDAQLIELDLAELETMGRNQPKHQPLIRVPGIIRDVSFEVPRALPAGEIIRVMATAAGDLCESVEPFDLFEGEGVPKDCRAVAFRLMYRDPKARTAPEAARTLTDAQVDERQCQVIDAVHKQFGIALRG
jgi:phenylalanyl-tRNA synthetase beta chain